METVFISVPEAGKSLGIGLTKAWELVYSGELASVKVGARRLVPVKAVKEYAERLMAAAGTAA